MFSKLFEVWQNQRARKGWYLLALLGGCLALFLWRVVLGVHGEGTLSRHRGGAALSRVPFLVEGTEVGRA